VADKKAAIGYTYEASSGGPRLDSIDDDDASSDEDIDLGRSFFGCCQFRPRRSTCQLPPVISTLTARRGSVTGRASDL